MKGERITGTTPLGNNYIRDFPDIKDYRVQTKKYAMSFEWTTEPPTQEGLYRAIARDNGLAYWVELTDFAKISIFSVYLIGIDTPKGVDDFTHWLGPLPVPEPPKRK